MARNTNKPAAIVETPAAVDHVANFGAIIAMLGDAKANGGVCRLMRRAAARWQAGKGDFVAAARAHGFNANNASIEWREARKPGTIKGKTRSDDDELYVAARAPKAADAA